MQSIDLIRENLERSRDRVLARVEEMRDHALVPPTAEGGGHTLWILGHLAYIEALVVMSFVCGSSNPLESWKEAFDGSEVVSDPDPFPPFGEVLEICRDQRQATLTYLEGLCESDLDAPSSKCPPGFEDTFGTKRLCLQFLADHWYMHRGQLADCRRSARVDRMWL